MLKGVNPKEAGTYTVKVFADLGTISADAKLKVNGKCLKVAGAAYMSFNFYHPLS